MLTRRRLRYAETDSRDVEAEFDDRRDKSRHRSSSIGHHSIESRPRRQAGSDLCPCAHPSAQLRQEDILASLLETSALVRCSPESSVVASTDRPTEQRSLSFPDTTRPAPTSKRSWS